MKKLQNNFTTPEQSKRLLESGVPANSADMWYIGALDKRGVKYDKFPVFPCSVDYQLYDRDKPCWSVGRLMEILCICYKTDMRFRGYCRGGMIESLINTYEDLRYEIEFSKLEE